MSCQNSATLDHDYYQKTCSSVQKKYGWTCCINRALNSLQTANWYCPTEWSLKKGLQIMKSYKCTIIQGVFKCFSKMKKIAQPMHYASIPIEKVHQGILVKCFCWSPFSQCIIFSDKIFSIQYLISFTFIIYLGTKWVSSDKTGNKQRH